MASKALPLSIAALALLAGAPPATAWDWTQDEPNLVHQVPGLHPAGSTYFLVGMDLGQPPGPATPVVHHCWRISGDLRIQEDSPECWREEPEDATRGAYQTRLVVAAVILGQHRCFAEVDGTEVRQPCCSREEDSFLPPCAGPPRRTLP